MTTKAVGDGVSVVPETVMSVMAVLTKRESWVHDEDVCVGGQGKREMGSAVSPTLRNKKDDGLK